MPSMARHLNHVGEKGAYEEKMPCRVNIRSKIPVRNNQEMIYSGADTVPDCQARDPF